MLSSPCLLWDSTTFSGWNIWSVRVPGRSPRSWVPFRGSPSVDPFPPGGFQGGNYLEVEVNNITRMNIFHCSAYLIHKSSHFEFIDFLVRVFIENFLVENSLTLSRKFRKLNPEWKMKFWFWEHLGGRFPETKSGLKFLTIITIYTIIINIPVY